MSRNGHRLRDRALTGIHRRPWDPAGMAGFLSMMLFLGILTVGFIYEWKKGALDWE